MAEADDGRVGAVNHKGARRAPLRPDVRGCAPKAVIPWQRLLPNPLSALVDHPRRGPDASGCALRTSVYPKAALPNDLAPVISLCPVAL